jgi:hypothetical protein
MTASTAEPPTKIVEASSGPKLSGSGKDWSEWYQVRIGAAPAGYSVEKTEFWLSGDRTCGAWAECKELTKDETQVIWQFRLKGMMNGAHRVRQTQKDTCVSSINSSKETAGNQGIIKDLWSRC